MLLNKIHLECTFGPTYTDGGTLSSPTKISGDIVASTPLVQCEDNSMLAEGDNVKVEYSGTSVTPSTSNPATASVVVTIARAGQTNIYVSRT